MSQAVRPPSMQRVKFSTKKIQRQSFLIDTSNALNAINRKSFLHNVCVICPETALFVRDCYSLLSRIFIIGSELKSCEGRLKEILLP